MELKKMILTCGITLTCLLGGCSTFQNQNIIEESEMNYTDIVMDTVFSVKMYGGQEGSGQKIKEQLQKLEEEELSWRIPDSEIAKMNDSFSRGEAFVMGEDMTVWAEETLQLAKDSQGAFDPTIGSLTRLWNIEGDNPKVPEKEDLQSCMQEIGYQQVHIKENTIYIEETRSMDLGAAGKGIACDLARAWMEEEKEIKGATISVGGSILTYGEKPQGDSWNVAIQKPEAESGVAMGVLHVKGTHFISTSGDYEKYFEENGKRYHHILDPHTGYPAESDLSSVTIVCNQGLLSDVLSTACFVLGEEKSEALLDKYHATGIFIDHQNKVKVYGEEKDCLELLDKNYELISK